MRVLEAVAPRRFRLFLPPAVLPALAASVLMLSQCIFFAGFELTIAPSEPAGRPFLIRRIPNGATFSQSLDVKANGLDSLRLSGVVTGRGRSGLVEATLVEMAEDGTERVVRSASAKVDGACCTIAFLPVPDSAGRRFRLDVTVRDFDASAPLSLWAVPVNEGGGLSVNRRMQKARLELEGSATGSTAVSRLRRDVSGGPRVSLPGLLAGLAFLDVAFVCCASGLLRLFVTSCDPLRP